MSGLVVRMILDECDGKIITGNLEQVEPQPRTPEAKPLELLADQQSRLTLELYPPPRHLLLICLKLSNSPSYARRLNLTSLDLWPRDRVGNTGSVKGLGDRSDLSSNLLQPASVLGARK